MKPILITGGAKGFGAEICRRLASDGHDIVVHYRHSEAEALQVISECKGLGVKAEAIQGDFSSIESLEIFIKSFLSRFSHSKGLVNNVGNYLIASSSETEDKEWLDLFQTNFFTPVYLIRALLPALKETKGSVVNIGTSGLSGVYVKATAYASTKAALWFYTRSLAKELAPFHVTVNMVSPGFLETSLDLEEAPRLPMGRPATLKEASDAVAFFFEEQHHYITGQNLEVAGGFGF